MPVMFPESQTAAAMRQADMKRQMMIVRHPSSESPVGAASVPLLSLAVPRIIGFWEEQISPFAK